MHTKLHFEYSTGKGLHEMSFDDIDWNFILVASARKPELCQALA